VIRRRLACCTAGIAVAFGPVACADGEASTLDPAEGKLRVLVADMALRQPGRECSGAVPFQYIHAGSVVSFDDGKGTQPIAIELPVGSAIRGDTIDWGTSPRVPTNCEFIVDARVLEEGVPYAVDVAGHFVEHPYTYPSQLFQGMPTLIIPSTAGTGASGSPSGTPSDGPTESDEENR
jgi:hypothetical protein